MATIETLDPHYKDGEPHRVAEFAGVQAREVVEFAQKRVAEFHWAACNAWLTAEYHRTGTMPEPETFDESPQGRQFATVELSLQVADAELSVLTVAAAYDPRAL